MARKERVNGGFILEDAKRWVLRGKYFFFPLSMVRFLEMSSDGGFLFSHNINSSEAQVSFWFFLSNFSHRTTLYRHLKDSFLSQEAGPFLIPLYFKIEF